MFWINFVLTFVEFFVFGINQDLLGGIFGLVIGVNQYTNLYFVIISVYCIQVDVYFTDALENYFLKYYI